MAFFIITMCARLYMYIRVGILIPYGKHLHDSIISHWGEAWAHAIIVAPPLFIEVSVQSLESELSCICVNVYIFCLYLRCCILDFGIVLIVRYFLFFIFKIIISCLYKLTPNWVAYIHGQKLCVMFPNSTTDNILHHTRMFTPIHYRTTLN